MAVSGDPEVTFEPKMGVTFLRLGSVSHVHPQLHPHTVTELTHGITTVEKLEEFYQSNVLCVYMCVHACECTLCMCVCVYVRTYVCMYVCTYICMYVSMYVCMYVRTYVCMYVHMYVCMYVCA